MDEEKEIKELLKEQKKPKLIDKILESNKLGIIINKIQDLSNSIKKLIVNKLKLDNEEKEGKLFIILFAVILFIMISIITTILLTPLFGIHLIFSLIRYSVFLLYKIIKNKGREIKKYLNHKYPTSNIFKEKETYQTNTNFANLVFMEVSKLIEKMDKLNLTKEEKSELALRIKEIVLLVRKEDGTIKQELYNLNMKQKIISSLSDIDFLLDEYKKREIDEFYNTRNNLLETLDDVIESTKVYRKYENKS